MSDTGIIWTQRVWNPTTGCDRASTGCDHCYALTMARRLKAMGQAKYQTDGDPRTSGPGFGLAEHPDALRIPLHWGKPSRVFVNSMSDLFHPDVSTEFIARVFAVMALSPHLTFQLLTKRHARLRSVLSSPAFQVAVKDAAYLMAVGEDPAMTIASTKRAARAYRSHYPPMPSAMTARIIPWPLLNVWVGVSAENQEWADIRIPALLATPATVRWLSAEPLLGPIDLRYLPFPRWSMSQKQSDGVVIDAVEGKYGVPGLWKAPAAARLNWVITGGESGPGARPADHDWFRDIRDQCTPAGVAYLHKQHGGRTPKSNGRELDGRCWDQYPA